MSLSLDFLSAAGHELPALPTPDSRALGSRPVYKHEVPTPPAPPRDDLIPVSPSSPPFRPSSMSSPTPPPIPQLQRETTRRRLLPPAMTDLQLCMEWGASPLTPFSFFVAPGLFTSSERFPRFMDLPPEVHRLIFQLCDTPTLFHLMHTSSYTRFESLKLFWQPRDNTWYHPHNSYQIFDFKESPVYHCHDFASRITQVEIPLSLDDPYLIEVKGREFWDRVQELFPSAHTVVLSSHPLGGRRGHAERDPFWYPAELVEFSPSNISAFVALSFEREDDEEHMAIWYRLWQVKARSWNLIEDTWTPMRVTLPPRKVPRGLLNDFLASERLKSITWREMRAIVWLKLETYARYSNSSGIECPDPECESPKFHRLEEFRKHMWAECRGSSLFTRDVKSILSIFVPDELKDIRNRDLVLCHPNTPVECKEIIDMKQRRVDKLVSIRNALNNGLRDQYRRPGEAKLQFEEILTAQMKEYGYLPPELSLHSSFLWNDCRDDNIFDFYDSEYPDAKDIDPECPEEEFLDSVYAGEEYFEYTD